MEQPKILIVDDDYSFAHYAKILLEKMGYQTVSLLDGRKAHETALAEKPALILMDMSMRTITGTEAITKLKSDPKTEKIPILLCSITNTRSEVQGALTAGAADFLSKPLQRDELQQKIKRLIQ